MANLRSILAEIERVAWAEAEAGRSLDAAVVSGYASALNGEIEGLRPSFRAAAFSVALGAGLSLVTGPLPLAVGVAAGAAQAVGSAVKAKVDHERSWISAADRLRCVRPTGCEPRT